MTLLLDVFANDPGPPEERAVFDRWIGVTMDTIDCEYCTANAVGLDEDGEATCGGCMPVVAQLPAVIEASGEDDDEASKS